MDQCSGGRKGCGTIISGGGNGGNRSGSRRCLRAPGFSSRERMHRGLQGCDPACKYVLHKRMFACCKSGRPCRRCRTRHRRTRQPPVLLMPTQARVQPIQSVANSNPSSAAPHKETTARGQLALPAGRCRRNARWAGRSARSRPPQAQKAEILTRQSCELVLGAHPVAVARPQPGGTQGLSPEGCPGPCAAQSVPRRLRHAAAVCRPGAGAGVRRQRCRHTPPAHRFRRCRPAPSNIASLRRGRRAVAARRTPAGLQLRRWAAVRVPCTTLRHACCHHHGLLPPPPLRLDCRRTSAAVSASCWLTPRRLPLRRRPAAQPTRDQVAGGLPGAWRERH